MCARIEQKISENWRGGGGEGKYLVHVESLVSGVSLSDPEMTIDEFVKDNPSNRFTISIFFVPLFEQDKDPHNAKWVLPDNVLGDLYMLPGGTVNLYIVNKQQFSEVERYCVSTDTVISEHPDIRYEFPSVSIPFENGCMYWTDVE